MNKNNFVHLHLHTGYSLLDGACRVEQVVKAAAEDGMTAVAMTDHGVMYGIIDFYKEAQAKGIKPILGCEAYVADGSRFTKKSSGGKPPIYHLVLLAANSAGYHNLIKLVTAAHLEGYYYKPRIDKELLAKHHEGLIGLSGCLKGEIADCLLKDDTEKALAVAGEYGDILGRENFYLELQDQSLPEQGRLKNALCQLAKKTGFPLVATNDVHYLNKSDASAHEVLLCLQTQTTLNDPKRLRFSTEEFYFKTGREMAKLFKDVPDAITATQAIAERCNVELDFTQRHFPAFHVPEGTTPTEFLVARCREGLKRRYGISDIAHPENERQQEIIERFRYELRVIEETGFVNYFLVVWDFVQFARRRGIPVGQRGSGGASLVAYCLGIADIDPLQYGLVFERFLNPERVSPPDFDVDFCQIRRNEVIDYVKEKYGRENVAQIITFGSLGAKAVIRDVGRVLEIPYAECDRFAKMVPPDPKMTLQRALDLNPELKRTYGSNPNCKRIFDYSFVLEGLYRNAGTHAAGVVIGEKPLVEIVPLSRDKDNEIITQYSMEPLSDTGLLKMDFLGLRTLTVMQETVNLIKQKRGIEVNLESIPIDDKATYTLLNRGDTIGVFQLEGSGMRDLIRRVGVNSIEDLIAIIALFRPGPMHMLDDYVNRKSGKARLQYDHPLLKPILEETYGVMIYQEQVQKAAHVLAGYTLAQGDILRRAMAKKKPEEMELQRTLFVKGCSKTNRIPENQAAKIFDTLAKFAGYGFNKAHSTAYALVAFRTAYLKANYPSKFMAALLSSEMGNADKLPVFINEAKQMGIRVLAPDINESEVQFMPVKGGIRFGLAGIKNVGYAAAQELVREREKGGPYKGLVDFCSRLNGQVINKKIIESLVRCGAFDALGIHRARVFNSIDFAMNRGMAAQRDQRAGQGSLFDMLGSSKEKTPGSEELLDCQPWHESELLAGEKELLGVYMSGHPLTEYSAILEQYQLCTVGNVHELPEKTITRVGGIITRLTSKVTKTKKEFMAILELESLDGSIETIVFPDVYRDYHPCLAQDAAVLVCGEVSKQEDKARIVAREIYPLADAPKYFAERLSVHIPAAIASDSKLEEIKSILRLHPGTVPVVICLQFPAGEKVFLMTANSFRVTPDERLTRKLRHSVGENSVYVAAAKRPCVRAGRPNRQ